MSEDSITSSDEQRTAKPLKYAQILTLDSTFNLELGGKLRDISICYETYGTLNNNKSNAVLIFHALSGDSHVASHNQNDDPGWWEIAVGPGKAIDTDTYYVICANILGGCRGTTGPNSRNPESGDCYGMDFPAITITDMVQVQYKLIQYLGIEKLSAIIGGSMGGHLVLSWAQQFPDSFSGAIAIATSPHLTSQALAFDIVGRNAILHDLFFKEGKYYKESKGPVVGLAIARMIGHITYLSRESMKEKFQATRTQPKNVATRFEKKFSVGSYLGYQGDKFVERFDANSYIYLTMAMDLFNLGDSVESIGSALSKTTAKWLVISFTSDWLFPQDQSEIIVDSLIAHNKEVSYCNVKSSCGHDAFLLPNNLNVYGSLIHSFIESLNGKDTPEKGRENSDVPFNQESQKNNNNSNNIFMSKRIDYNSIINLIPPGSSVLDLGCGCGDLLFYLKKHGYVRLMGIEIDEAAILSCMKKGLNVINADLNKGLSQFKDKQFDIIVLSETLQAILDIEGLLGDIIRVGKKGIVSIPNFAYYKLRNMLYNNGRAPESSGVLKYKWYNTPNRRFMSIDDVKELCKEKGIRIQKMIAFDTEAKKEIKENPNYYADIAIMVISE